MKISSGDPNYGDKLGGGVTLGTAVTGDVSGGLPGDLVVSGIGRIPILATPPTDLQRPQYIAANADIEWTDDPAPAFATPAIVLGTAAAAGAASTVIRSDATIVAFDATAPSTQAVGDAAATGSAVVAARRDHKHAVTNPLTAQDDVWVGGASGAPGRLGKGTDGQVLTVDPTTHHLVWKTPGDVTWLGAWSDATSYVPGDGVSLGGVPWVCVLANTALMPLDPDYRVATVSRAPLSYWRVGEASGTVAVDEMGAYTSTYVPAPSAGAVVTLGVAGTLAGDSDTAVKFSGLPYDHNAAMSTPALPALAHWSVKYRQRGEATCVDYSAIFIEIGDFQNVSRFADDSIRFYDGAAWTTTGASLATGETADFCWTFDGTTLTLYKNGVSVYSAARGRAIGSAAWWWGANSNGTGGTPDTLDEPAIWGRAVTPSEISGLHAVATEVVYWEPYAGPAVVTTKGDLFGYSTAAARVPVGSNTEVLTADSAQALGLKYAFPPGHEFDYVQKTTMTTVSATTEATANTVVTANAVTYDGSTVIIIEFFASWVRVAGSGNDTVICVYDGSGSVGQIATLSDPHAGGNLEVPALARWRLTPSGAAHTYSIRAWQNNAGTGLISGGSAGSGQQMPSYIRQTKV